MATIEFKASVSKGKDNFKYQMAKDFRSFSRNELAKECRRYFDMANKRIKRLEQSEAMSPALHAVIESGGKFYAKGADLRQLQHEYARCVNFLNMSTSTVGGAKRYERNLEAKLGGHKLTKDQKSLLFRAFRQIEKTSPAGVQAYGSDRLVQYLADEIDNEDANIMDGVGSQDWEVMIEKVIKEVSTEYENVMDAFYNQFRDVFSLD